MSFIFPTRLSGPQQHVSVVRIRRAADTASWKDATETTIAKAWVEQRASDASPDPQSEQTVTTEYQLVVLPSVDVQEGDRIRDAEGRLYDVDELPSANTNPMSDWQPYRFVPLVRVT